MANEELQRRSRRVRIFWVAATVVAVVAIVLSMLPDPVEADIVLVDRGDVRVEVVDEGRIVVAGSYADRGDLPGAIRLLEKGWRIPPRPQIRHLRRAYALADLYERSGQTVRARELFRWVMDVDREFADVVERVRTLG